jgi:hypothetical protein
MSGQEQCIYCGAALGDVTSADSLDMLRKSGGVFREESKRNGISYHTAEEHKVYDSLEDLPGDLRKKIEEAIKKGEGGVAPEFFTQEQDIFSVLSHPKTPRRARMHPLILALIFFASAAVVGIVLWLIM